MLYSVIIRPSPKACIEIDNWRARFDAHYKLIGPHLTVAFPGNLQSPVKKIQKHLRSTASKFSPFTVAFSRWVGADELLESHPRQTRALIDRYPNAVNMIVLLVSNGATDSLSIRRSASAVIPQPDSLLEYPPYVAIGQTLSDRDYESAKAALVGYRPKARFTATAIELLAQQPSGYWKTLGEFPLGETASEESYQGGKT